jgi:hypothetical protein
VPEFEIRLFSAAGDIFQATLTDAVSEDAALAKAATLAKKNEAAFFDVRLPTTQRWVGGKMGGKV